jgi:hypothetical protein
MPYVDLQSLHYLSKAAVSAAGPGWAALFISLAGLGVAAVSLGWQVVSYLRSNSRVIVEVRYGTYSSTGAPIVTPQATQLGAIDTATTPLPIYLGDELVKALRSSDLQQLWLIAEITNVGRLPVTIRGCQWHTAKSGNVQRLPTFPGTTLPHRLEVNDQCIAAMDLATIVAIFDAPFGRTKSADREIWPVVDLSSRRRTSEGNRIQIPITTDPTKPDQIIGTQKPHERFVLRIEYGSTVGGREGTLVVGQAEQGTITVGDTVELANASGSGSVLTGICVGVGGINKPDRDPAAGPLVGVLVDGIQLEAVHAGDSLRTK